MRKSIVAVSVIAVAATFGIAAAATARLDRGADAAPPAPEAAAETSLDDATIVAIFDAANTADIETGRLAAERGASKEVREFGVMLQRDHQQVRQLGRDLAAKLGVVPTPPKDDQGAKDHAAAMKRLRALEGSAFDHAFLRHEAAFHAAVIDAVNTTLLPAIRNAELKSLVEKVAPAFHGHMVAAQNLERKLAGGSGSLGK